MISGQENENKRKRKDRQILDKKKKRTGEHPGEVDINCSWCTGNSLKKIGNGIGTVGNCRKNRDHSDQNILEIGQNTEKSPGDQRRIAVTQTSVKDHQLTKSLEM